MKKWIIFVVFVLTICVPLFSQPQTLTIMHLNDSHSCLLPGGPRDDNLQGKVGGIARVATVVEHIRQNDPNALLLHCGDFSIGDLFFSYLLAVPELSYLKAIGCDALGLQNHEFDLGPSLLYTAIASVYTSDDKVPIVASNVYFNDPSVEQFLNFVQPYLIKDYNGVKVGILSLTTPAANEMSNPAPVEISDDIENILTHLVTVLKMSGCDIVVLMSGMGLYYDLQIAKNSIFIDIIIGGDDHFVMYEPIVEKNAMGQDVYIVQAGPFYRNMGVFNIEFEGSIQSISWQNVELNESIPEHIGIKTMLEGLTAEVESLYESPYTLQFGNVLNFYKEELTPEELFSAGYKDTPVGTLVCKSYKNWILNQSTEPAGDFYFTTGGSTAQPLYPGPIVKADVFRMISYGYNTDNTLGYRLARITLSGFQIFVGLNSILNTIEQNDEFLVQAEDLQYVYNSNLEENRLIEVKIKGELIDLEKIYTAYTNEFVAYFLTALGLTQSVEVLPYTSEYLAVLEYIAQNPVLDAPTNENILNIAEPTYVVEAQPKNLGFNVFPNPANNFVKFNFSEELSGNLTLAVFDYSGKMVKSLKNITFSGTAYTLDIQELPAGIYSFVLIGDGWMKHGRFVISR